MALYVVWREERVNSYFEVYTGISVIQGIHNFYYWCGSFRTRMRSRYVRILKSNSGDFDFDTPTNFGFWITTLY